MGRFPFLWDGVTRRSATAKVEYWRLLWGIELTGLDFSQSLEEIILYQYRPAFSMNWAFSWQLHLTYWFKGAFLHQPRLAFSVKRAFSYQPRLRYWVIEACFYQPRLVLSVKRTFSCQPRIMSKGASYIHAQLAFSAKRAFSSSSV